MQIASTRRYPRLTSKPFTHLLQERAALPPPLHPGGHACPTVSSSSPSPCSPSPPWPAPPPCRRAPRRGESRLAPAGGQQHPGRAQEARQGPAWRHLQERLLLILPAG